MSMNTYNNDRLGDTVGIILLRKWLARSIPLSFPSRPEKSSGSHSSGHILEPKVIVNCISLSVTVVVEDMTKERARGQRKLRVVGCGLWVAGVSRSERSESTERMTVLRV